MSQWRKTIVTNRYLLLIILFYLISHLLNITLLPIFNDESIYLDWGWVQTHTPGHLYDSLVDAKQPLMLWLFGIFSNFFADPLVAGRFVSVLFGLGSLVGLYALTQRLFDKPTALVTAFMYSITPIFVFYDRQALLESGVTCMAIWAAYAFLRMFKDPTSRNSYILGVLLGIGFFIKSSMLLFVFAATVVIAFTVIKKKRHALIKSYLEAFGAFVLVNILIFINPVFWQYSATTSRYTFTLGELFMFPVPIWITSVAGFFEIGFYFLTPLLFLAGIAGVVLIAREKDKERWVFLGFFIVALVVQLLIVKNQSQRYLVSTLPFLIVCASYLFTVLWKGNVFKRSLVILSLLLSLGVTLLQLSNPVQYIKQFSAFTRYAETAHIHGQTSGFGIHEMIEYLKSQNNPSQPAMVFFGFNVGNPESAVSLYTQKTGHLIGLHLDAQLFQKLDQIDCFTSKYPAYVVTRENQLMGMEKYFIRDKAFVHPDKNYSIGVYKLKTDCKGNSAVLSNFYQTAIDVSLQQRKMY